MSDKRLAEICHHSLLRFQLLIKLLLVSMVQVLMLEMHSWSLLFIVSAVVHGDGVYFAVNANYSARDTYSPRDANNNKRMYQCRVLTGEFCKSKQGMKVPPNKPRSNHILYDSVVDNPLSPGIFVIFNDTQAYPEYLITFQWPEYLITLQWPSV